MIIEKLTLTNGEDMFRPATTLVSTIKCKNIVAGDLILTTAPMDTAKVLKVTRDPLTDDVTLMYTSVGKDGVMTSKFHSDEKLSRVEKNTLN